MVVVIVIVIDMVVNKDIVNVWFGGGYDYGGGSTGYDGEYGYQW